MKGLSIDPTPIQNDFNVYKYLKDADNKCISGHIDCCDGTSGRSVFQYSERSGYHDVPYGLNGAAGVDIFSRTHIDLDIKPYPNPATTGIEPLSISKYSGNPATYTAKFFCIRTRAPLLTQVEIVYF